MLTEDTKNAFLCIELIDENRTEEFKNALKNLAEEVHNNLGGTYKIRILDIDNKEEIIE